MGIVFFAFGHFQSDREINELQDDILQLKTWLIHIKYRLQWCHWHWLAAVLKHSTSMDGKHNFAVVCFSLVFIADRYLKGIMTRSLFPSGESDLIKGPKICNITVEGFKCGSRVICNDINSVWSDANQAFPCFPASLNARTIQCLVFELWNHCKCHDLDLRTIALKEKMVWYISFFVTNFQIEPCLSNKDNIVRIFYNRFLKVRYFRKLLAYICC